MTIDFAGVYPAITTPFSEDGSVDFEFLVRHARWMMDAGCHGIIPCGSLGEGGSLSFDEKVEVVRELAQGLPGVPVVPGVAALSTRDAAAFAEASARAGAKGLMVLPPYAYSTDWREMKAHVREVMKATDLPCILYNNPIAYKTDFLPEQVAELAAEVENLVAVKESSGDVRRVTALRAAVGERLTLMVGVDDLIVEGVYAGAEGWVAGLVNAMPRESVLVWQWARERRPEVVDLYDWFLPLLRLDVVPKFVQLIKLAQQEVGMGSERVRPPRLALEGSEREAALNVIRTAIANRPALETVGVS
jgi:1-pyrroline-4-hydroxy-2-carboxylate deaminase